MDSAAGWGVGRIFKIGSQAINSRLEAYYNVERPDAAPDWTIAFAFQFLFPKQARREKGCG